VTAQDLRRLCGGKFWSRVAFTVKLHEIWSIDFQENH